MPELIILADDLSGACEAAATFLLRTTRIQVSLNEGPHVVPDRASAPRVLALDSDSRHLPPDAAAARVARLLEEYVGPGDVLVKKVDSLLRGNLVAEVRQARRTTGAHPVLAPSLPAAGRTVVGGVVHVEGTRLSETALWRAEARPAPASVAEALAPLPCRVVPLAVVRGDRQSLVSELGSCAAQGRVPVCDAETDADLDAVVDAARRALGHPLLVGSAGLVGAVARAFTADSPAEHQVPDPAAAGVLVAVGSAAPSVRAQVEQVRVLADAVVEIDPGLLLADPPRAARDAAAALEAAHVALLVLDPAAPVRPQDSAHLAAALADVAARVASDRSLVLTGGQTARAVLDALHVTGLRPLVVDHGAVTSRTDDGRFVITRPGSFGTPSSLAELTATLLAGTVPDRLSEGA